jgi:hypothetical protein
MPISPQARDLAIRVVLGEAGNQGPEGMLAVANVLKNRAVSGAWGDPYNGGLTRVINAPKQFASMVGGGKAYSPNDPNYQRAGAIVDQVFNGQAQDNTGGATHFYANKGPNATAAPDWATGATNVRQIGDQTFMTMPLTAANTAGTAVTGPSSVPPPGPSLADAEAARAFLATLSSHTDRAGDTANLNPDFAVRLASAVKQARAENIPISVFSAFREPGQTGSAYDAGGNSSHSYGLAADIAGLDGPNGKITQRWAQIAQANGLSNPYGIGNGAEYNHWQLPPVPLEQTPQLLASLKAAKATGSYANVWAAYQGGQTGEAPRSGPYMPTGEAEANKPAPLVKPVAAVAPPGSAPAPGSPQNTPAGSSGLPGPNDRFQVLQTMGQGGRPGLPYTALNLAPGAGSTPIAAAPAPAPAAPTTARPDVTQRTPLDQTPTPVPKPPELGGAGSPASNNMPFPGQIDTQGNWGPTAPTPTPPRPVAALSPDLTAPNNAAGGRNPIMTDVRFGAPVASDQNPLTTNPLFASAQNLLKLLYPTG